MTYSGYEMQLAEKDARIESLRQQLEDAKTVSDHNLKVYHAAAEVLRQQLADSQKQVVMLRSALRHLWNERTPDSLDEAGEALAATADLNGLILCDAGPVADVKKHTGEFKDMAIIVWRGEQPPEGTHLYKARKP